MKSAISGILTMVLACVLTPLPVCAQTEKEAPKEVVARDVFVELQAPALEILKKNTRLDMLDYWDADSVYRARNAMSGLSWLVEVKPDYLKVQITPVSTLEIKLLPDKKGKIAMTVYTVGDTRQASDSQVDFYDLALQRLDTKKYLKAPELKDFFDLPKGSATTMKEISGMIPFPTVEYSASPENNDISARLTVGEFMSVDDYNIIKLFLKPEIVLRWDGKYKLK